MQTREQVLATLEVAARRLRLTRAAEAAAVGAAAGGFCAAAMLAGWRLAGVSRAGGAAFCAAAALGAAGVLLSRRCRRRLDLPGGLAAALAALCGAALLAGAVAAAVGVRPSAAPLALLLVPACALAAPGHVLAAGVTPRQAGIYHDLRLGLKERLGTAAELAARADDGPFAREVYHQALLALRAEHPERSSVWRRTRATAGALALALVLAGVAAALPARRDVGELAAVRGLAQRAERLSPQQRADLVAALQRLAEQVERNPALREALRAAAAAARDNSPAELQQQLDEAADALAAEQQAAAARIAGQILAAAGLTDGNAGGGARARPAPRTTPTGGDANATSAGARPLAARTVVWEPHVQPRAAPGQPAPATRSGPAGPVAFADAWTAAQDRAASALAAGAVPGEYRPVVRRFFELDNRP